MTLISSSYCRSPPQTLEWPPLGRTIGPLLFLTGILVAVSVISLSPRFAHGGKDPSDNRQLRQVRGRFFDLNQESHTMFCGSLSLVSVTR
jgi:hypothetical protein